VTKTTPTNDCGCIIHEGPHFLHMDRLDWERNINRLRETGGVRGFVIEEAARLRELAHQLQAHGMDRLPPGHLTEPERDKIVLEVLREWDKKRLTKGGLSPREWSKKNGQAIKE
jgi:hypothetical protein